MYASGSKVAVNYDRITSHKKGEVFSYALFKRFI